MSNYSILQLHNVSLTLPLLSKPILQNINYEVSEGDFIVLLGGNGSGKSSLLKLLDRRYQKTSGQIKFSGRNLEDLGQVELAQTIIALTQNCGDSLFGSLTVLENCRLAKTRCHKAAMRFSMNVERDFFADYLLQFNRNLPHKLYAITSNLSGGEQQALALALTVLHPPRLLLLDEHTSALDPQAALHLMALTDELIKRYKMTCIMTTHDLEIAADYGNKIVILRDGKIHHYIDKCCDKKNMPENLLAML